MFLLLPLWLNLEEAAEPPVDAPDAPEERAMCVEADHRVIFTEHDDRIVVG